MAALINQQQSIVEGIRYAQGLIDGSMTMLIMTPQGIYAARDKMGRTPLVLGKKKGAVCASFESSAFINLGYEDYKELGPAEIALITPEGAETVSPAQQQMKFCTFMWVYYGYPTSTYEGVNVEQMRYRCGESWQDETRCALIWWQACRTPVLPMRLDMPTGPGFHLLVRSSNIRRPGPAPLCRPIRPSGT